MPEDPPLTPIEQSRADTGRRHYTCKNGFYAGLSTSLNARFGWPKGVGQKATTLQELPDAADAQPSIDGTLILISYPWRRLTDAEFDFYFNDQNPNIIELTKADWTALKPPPESP
tara:strand:- start:17817 stop:18161 length:345 start_codon:yes stop_codon:yes gene_type:complete